jgi:polysaccharide pyruvyl transferase WcaK-like protein
MINILITGYYKKQNTGDDLFEYIAKKLFVSKKKEEIKYKIKSIDEVKNDIHYISSNFDKIVLFGGETLNDYFLEPLAKIKELNQNIKLYALGVGLGADIEYIKQYLIMFQYIIVRHKEDYNLIKNRFDNLIPCEYIQDIVFMYDVNGYKTKLLNNNNASRSIGLFLSQPKLKKTPNLNNYIDIIIYYVENNYTVKLFSMCYSENINESDMIANKILMDEIPKKYRHRVKIVSNKSFENSIKTINFAICERFHAHILCIINNIPFISLGNTLKVKKLLEDLELSDLLKPDNLNISDIEFINKKKLLNIYNNTCKNVINFYSKLNNTDLDDLIIYPKNKIKYYFNNDKINEIINTIAKPTYKITNNILMNIFGTTSLDYKWGLEDKIKNNILNTNDIKWLIEQSIYKHYYLHNTFAENNTSGFNIDYIDQYDRTGCHRSGWRYIVDNINNQLSTSNKNAIKLDLYVDRTFHWCSDEMINKDHGSTIPYKTPWMGFIHHTMYKDEGNYNCIELLKNKYFIKSLEHCKGLIFLSKYLRDNFEKLASINNIKLPKLYNLYHPTETVDKLWHYKLWKGDVIQIGSWMRDMNAINELNYNKKHLLIGKQMEHKYICNQYNINNINKQVHTINYVNNDEYDNILSSYVVFLKLVDASAVNTLIECIIRNTPIIINKLPAVVEYLGEDYPLYYNNLEEVPLLLKRRWFNNKIKKAHKYLKHMNKDFLNINNFINLLNKIMINN